MVRSLPNLYFGQYTIFFCMMMLCEEHPIVGLDSFWTSLTDSLARVNDNVHAGLRRRRRPESIYYTQ